MAYPGEDDLVDVVTRALWPELGDRLTATRAVRVVLDEQARIARATAPTDPAAGGDLAPGAPGTLLDAIGNAVYEAGVGRSGPDPTWQGVAEAAHRAAQGWIERQAHPLLTLATPAAPGAATEGEEPQTAAEWGSHDGLLSFVTRASWTPYDEQDDAIPVSALTAVRSLIDRKLHAITHALLAHPLLAASPRPAATEGEAASGDMMNEARELVEFWREVDHGDLPVHRAITATYREAARDLDNVLAGRLTGVSALRRHRAPTPSTAATEGQADR